MFYGREYELSIIKNAICSDRSELGIVYGRRRIGKSSLLQKLYKRKGDIYFEALQKVPLKTQINHFLKQLSAQTKTPLTTAHDWNQAFDALTFYIKKGKHYVVFDEFPWMASGQTELISLLKYYWDNHWKKNSKLTLVLCGSIANFMLKHIVHSKALHNRKTFEIQLEPMSFSEAKNFFGNYRNDFEIAKFLMIFGGIPKYLEQINPKIPLSENLDHLCFQKHSFFATEFETIFKEQFKVVKNYAAIIKSLSNKSCSKEELSERLKISSGGGLSNYINSLEQASFVKTFTPQIMPKKSRKKTKKIVLWDEWLRFYFHYIEPNINIISINTQQGLFDQLTSQSLDSYFGLAFEMLCLKNLPAIFKNLNYDIQKIINFGPFFRQRKRDENRSQGLQIDILIHKKGNVLILVECKFSTNPIGISVIEDIERKIKFLKAPSNYTIERILLSAGQVTANLEKTGYFHHILGLKDLILI